MTVSPLVWRKIRAGMQGAEVTAGQYTLVRYPSGWSASWRQTGHRPTFITASIPSVQGGEAAAKRACEEHRLEYVADRLLKNAGSGKVRR